MRNWDYEKIRMAMRHWLLGRKYHLAHKALELGMKNHTGLRKDGVTPEFMHQMSQAIYVRSFVDLLMYPEETLATIFLHDVVEDCEVSPETIWDEFGPMVGKSVDLMTNQIRGVKKDKLTYYDSMQYDPIASFCKGVDRMHNHQTMVGVFSLEKQRDYIVETSQYVLPMIKNARKRFTQQEPAYQIVRASLMLQIELIEISLNTTMNLYKKDPNFFESSSV